MRRGRADPLDQWRADFEREVDLQNSVQHPAIVTILNRAQTNDGNPYFVMPLYPETLAIRRWGTNLPQPVTQPLNGETARKVLADILNGASEMHRAEIAHWNLKPQNILMGKNAVICDFGQAIRTMDISDHDIKRPGTFPYAAPKQRDGSAKLDRSADTYAIGMIAHLMLVGRLPHDGENIPDNVRPSNLADWITAALNPDPTQPPLGGTSRLLGDVQDPLPIAQQSYPLSPITHGHRMRYQSRLSDTRVFHPDVHGECGRLTSDR